MCGTPDVLAIVHDLRGILLFRAGRLPEALVELDAAVDDLEHLETFDRAALLLNRGTLHLLRHDLTTARDDLTRSAAIASEQGLLRMEFKARHNAGYAEYLAGNLPAALAAFAQADSLEVDVSRSVWHIDRARVLMEAGLLSVAEDSLAEATRLLALERANQDRAEAQLARAELALLQGDWGRAKQHSGQARRDFRRRRSTGWAARADVTRWQALLDTPAGAARVAREVTRQQVALAPPEGDLRSDRSGLDAEVGLIAAEAHLALGHVEDAAAYLDGLPGPRRSDPLSSRLHQHLVRAGVARAAADLSAARRELRTGLTALTREQARHHSLDLRTAMAVHGGRLAELDLRLALESRSPGRVFDSLERWRAMSHRRTAVVPPTDPELAGLLARLRLVTEDLRGAPEHPATDRLRRHQHHLQQAVREREWALQGEGRSRREVRLRELRPQLTAHGTDVLCYFVLDEHLSAVTVTRGRCSVTALAPWEEVSARLTRVRADLDALAGRMLPEALRRAITSSLTRDLGHLDALLLPVPVATTDRLVVVPSRTLAMLPWGMLPHRRGRSTTVSVSMTGWARGLQEGARRAPAVAAVAGPGLPLADREVHDVASGWAAKARSSTSVGARDATAATLADVLTRHDLVHIAAHGTHNHDNPLFSSVRLVGGPLFAYDVPQDAPVAEHVVLSACDLGMTTPRPGGEVLGLTAALLGMGSRCVVSSVARVDDAVAYATMLDYHRLLASGVDSATALGRATADDEGLPAPFVCFGSAWSPHGYAASTPAPSAP